MSYKDWRVRIEDIIDAIDRISDYIDGMSEAEVTADEKTVDAIVRNLEIIGEAAHAVPHSIQERHNRLPWGVMAEMRNILIHEYHSVEPQIIYRTAINDLPPLAPMLRALLEEENMREAEDANAHLVRTRGSRAL